MMKRIAVPLVLVAISTACAMKSKHSDQTPAERVSAEAPAAAKATEATEDKDDHAPQTPASPAAKATPHFKTHDGVDPEKALGWLKNGNTRFLKGHWRKDGQSHKDVARLSKGQKPHTIVLSCSDSRVPPELVFDQKLGEIFTIRTVGEAVDDSVVASIEYAIEHLGSRLILVMGHTSCGAVRAAVGTLKGGDAGTPALNRLVATLHPHLQSFKDKTPTGDFGAESDANAEGVIADLKQRSSLIREAVEGGDVMARTALYHLESGVVTIH